MIKRKTMAWVGGLMTVLVTITAWGVSTEADRRFDELAKRAAALESRLTKTHVRPVLSGTATAGNAWDAYSAAISLAKAAPGLEEQVRPSARKKLDSALRAMLLSDHSEILTQLHKGAHCREVREPIDWARGFDGGILSLLDWRGLSNLLVTQALAQIEHGDPVAAVDTLLDGAQLGRDFMHSHLMINEMIGGSVLGISTFWAVGRNDLLVRLSREALDRFARGLAILDEHLQKVGPSLQGEAVLFARTAQVHPELFKGMLSSGSWRHGFSSRLMFADIGLQMIDYADRATAVARGPYSNCDSYLSGLENEMIETGDPALSAVGIAKGILVARFQAIARLRLLRMAIEHRLSRPVPELIDPFGDTLQHEVGPEGKARFWSIGTQASGKLALFPHRS